MIKRNFYQFKRNNSLKFKIKVAIICSILVLGLICCFPHFLRNSYKVTIVNKRIIKQNNAQKYVIYAQLENGEMKVFEDKDSFAEFKINSEDIYYGMTVNRKYEIQAYGFDMPLFGYYQNISKVKGLKTDIPYYK